TNSPQGARASGGFPACAEGLEAQRVSCVSGTMQRPSASNFSPARSRTPRTTCASARASKFSLRSPKMTLSGYAGSPGSSGSFQYTAIAARVTTAITRLISTGTTEQALLAAVAHLFPNLSPAELSVALQTATVAAERKALRPH